MTQSPRPSGPPATPPTPAPPLGPAIERARLRVAGRAVTASITPGATGSVLAVFPRSLYLAWDDGEVVCLGAMGLGPGPLNGLCTPAGAPETGAAAPWRPGAAAVGDRARRVGDGLTVGRRLHITTDGTRAWHPLLPEAPVRPETLRRGVRAMESAAAEQVAPRGLALTLLGGRGEPRRTTEAERRLLALAVEAAAALRSWLHLVRRSEPACRPPVPAPVLALLGLGPGLTPAGDDFLGGALIALKAFGAGAWPEAAAEALAEALAPLLAMHTGPISAAHLRHAMFGEGGEALHEAVTALAKGADDGWPVVLSRLDGIGHSSGWDALAGVRCVARALTDADGGDSRSADAGSHWMPRRP